MQYFVIPPPPPPPPKYCPAIPIQYILPGVSLMYIASLAVQFSVGMGRYEKYVDRDVANAKPYRIRDSAF